MTQESAPFAISAPLSPRLDDLLRYWRDLRRGEAAIPFADDLDMTRIDAIAGDVVLLGVFETPQRFRLDLARTPSAPRVEAELQHLFIDEIEAFPPLDRLQSQAAATVETAAPTLYEHRAAPGASGYGRLMLPAWGEGHVSMLVCAFEFTSAD